MNHQPANQPPPTTPQPDMASTLVWGMALILLGLGVMDSGVKHTLAIGMVLAALGVAFMLYRLIPGELSGEGKLGSMTFQYAGGLAGFVLALAVMLLLRGTDETTPAPAPIPIPAPLPTPDARPQTGAFKMQAYCQMHNVYGFGQSDIFADAKSLAIQDCADKGGVPSCCAQNVVPNY